MKIIALLAASLLLTANCHPARACIAMDREELANFQQPGVPPQLVTKISHGMPLSLQEVRALDSAHVHSGSIINYLYTWGGHFRLTEEQVAILRATHMSTDLLSYMLSPESGGSFAFF